MKSIDRRFDAIVIGSGAAGSVAVKELTERGLDVLLLEAGRDLTEADFTPPPPKAPRPLGMDLDLRAKAMLAGQHRQARRSFFSETSNRFLISDRENPYSTPRGAPYLWIRGRILGGRLNAYGRVLQRMSDVDFKAASRDGYGADWPVSYADLERWYDHVEGILGVYGNKDGLSHPPDGKYVGPAMLTAVEEEFKDKVAERWPERKVIAWRYAAPNLGRVPVGVAAARPTGRLTTRTDAVVQRITVDERTALADGAVFTDRLTKRQHRVFADVVVLCASTIE
jgi:choline dehydrogenase-like flavoprotein